MERYGSSTMTRKKIVGLLLLIVFVLIFIFSCTCSVLPFGSMLVGTFGYMVFPASIVLALISLAMFLGFSYSRSIKPTIYFMVAFFAVLLTIHSIATYKSLNAIVGAETLKNYLALNYEHYSLLGSFGSIFTGIISFFISGMGTVVLFVILATIFIGLFIDYQFYGKYEKKHIKKLKDRKIREKVNNSDLDRVDENVPNYSFKTINENNILSEVSVDASEYENYNNSSVNYNNSDVIAEISDEENANYNENNDNNYANQQRVTSFYTGQPITDYQANYFNQTQNYAQTQNYNAAQNYNQTPNYFDNSTYEDKTSVIPDVYDYNANEQRRQFMNATFGMQNNINSFDSTINSDTNENVGTDLSDNFSSSNFNSNIEESDILDSTTFSSSSLNSNNDVTSSSIDFGYSSSIESSQNLNEFTSSESDLENQAIDDEISKILNSTEEDIESDIETDYSISLGDDNLSISDSDLDVSKNDSFLAESNNFGSTFNENPIESQNSLNSFGSENITNFGNSFNSPEPKQEQNFNSSSLSSLSSQNNFGANSERLNQNLNSNVGGLSNFNTTSNFSQNSASNLVANPTVSNNNIVASPVSAFGTSNIASENKPVIPAKEQKKPYSFNYGMPGVRYNPPPLSLLRTPKPDTGDYTEEQERKSSQLENVLAAFNIPAKVKNIVRGPKITRYELSVPLGVSVKKIPMFENDIAAALAAKTIVIKAPIPGSSYVGIELENDSFSTVYERELLESEEFQNFKDPLPIAIGKDISGEIIVKSLAKMVHLLIAGSTGSGKSVFIHNIVVSLIFKHSPEELRLIMIDPKKVEFNRYNGLPHLLTPEVVMGADKAINALKWSVKEMQRRYDLLSKAGFNNIEPYNKSEVVKSGQFEKMPYIVIIVDELAEIMLVNKKEVEACIQSLTQLARACGMHIILATQRPSVDIISGVIKNNIPSRIAFSLQSGIDSKTILNSVGAEKLLGQGDMIFAPTGTSATPRLQAAYATDDEIKSIIDYDIKNNQACYDETVNNIINSEESASADSVGGGSEGGIGKASTDEYFKTAVKIVMQNGGASVSYLQRRLSIGYSRAARIIDQMEDVGYIGGATGAKVRQVLITPDKFKEDFGEDFNSID